MVEVLFTNRRLDLPFLLRIPNVTDEQFHELADPEMKAELFDGEMIVHSPAGAPHDDVAGFLRFLMRGFARSRGLGRVLGPDALFEVATGRRFTPDVAFVRQSRVPAPLPEEFDFPPDLVVEVLSPSTRAYDLNDKRPAYQAANVGEIWFLDPDNDRVIVDRNTGGGYVEEVVTAGRLDSAVLTGFWVEADWLWVDPPPDDLTCLQAILGGP